MQTEIDRWLAEGEALVAHQDYTLALVPLNRVAGQAASGPTSSKAWRLKSEALAALGHLEQSLVAADHAVQAAPTSTPRLLQQALIQRAQVYDRLQRYAEAGADYERATQQAPGDAWLWQRLGDALLNSGNHSEALAAYERASALKPNSPAAYYGQGLALERLERRTDALAAYEQALRIIPDGAPGHARILNSAALRLYGLRRPADALALTEQVHDLATATPEEHATAGMIAGDCLMELGMAADALAQYEQALALAPTHAGAWHAKGLALHQLDRPQEALAAYDEALRLGTTHPDAQQHRRYALAHALLSQRPPLNPDAPAFAEIADRKIWIEEARWFAGRRRLPETEAAVNQMLRLDPRDWFAAMFKVFLQLLQKRYRAAWATFRQAWRRPRQSRQETQSNQDHQL